MHLSARSELKTELSESRIETKLPINEVGLLHGCLTEENCSHAGALMLVMQEGPLCAASAHDQVMEARVGSSARRELNLLM